MESDLKCNNLSCRKLLLERAVVTTCSHIFCVECANALFTAAQLCPACEASLAEPCVDCFPQVMDNRPHIFSDDVVIASLRPTNDYKTSVLSGLSPGVILEICSRAIAFWQYQIHQESSYQQAILKSLSDKNSQVSKQFENAMREANSEITLLNNRLTGLERELELERRKTRDAQVALREKDKEYQKLKNQLDKTKRKVLFRPNSVSIVPSEGGSFSYSVPTRYEQPSHISGNVTTSGIEHVVDSMEMNKIQRTPMRQNPLTGFSNNWPQPGSTRQHYSHHYRTGSLPENSENEVDNMSAQPNVTLTGTIQPGYKPPRGNIMTSRGMERTSGGFRPAVFTH